MSSKGGMKENMSESDEDIESVADVKIENNEGTEKEKRAYKGKKDKIALNKTQRQELLNVAKEHSFTHYCMILLQMTTGIRVNELINLRKKDVDLINGFIHIRPYSADNYVRAHKLKTKSSQRSIPLPKNTLKTLKIYLSVREKTGYLFVSKRNRPFAKQSYNRIINQYARLCPSIASTGLKNIGSHTLRRTFASYNYGAGTYIGTISKYLGHSTIKTTQIYLSQITDFEKPDEYLKTMEKMVKEDKAR